MVSRLPRKIHHILPIPTVEVAESTPFGRDVAQEVEFLADLMELKPEHRILDVASGAGRHALELARRGFGGVTALDLSDQLLRIGTRCAESTGLKVEFSKGDPRKVKYHGEFDAALILGGGAFGLMENEDENQAILDATFEALKPEGKVVVSSMSLVWLLRQAQDMSGYDPQTSVLTTREEVQVEGGLVEVFPLQERYYAFPGLKRSLELAGFRGVMGFGAAPGRYSSRSISLEDPELLAYATRPKA